MNALIEGHWTMSGGLIFGDAEDECAPFVKITFHNEASGLTEAEKLRLLRTLVDFGHRAEQRVRLRIFLWTAALFTVPAAIVVLLRWLGV